MIGLPPLPVTAMQLKHPEADARMARSRGLGDYWPWLLRYPLTGYSLPVLLMLVAFIGFALGTARLPMGIPDTGLPLLCISLLLAVFYTLRVIDHTTQGYATPPPMGSEALNLFGAMKPLSLPAMMGLSALALHPEHPALLRVLLTSAVLVLPAYLFILATEENLASALNPLRWLKVISVMGFAYLLFAMMILVRPQRLMSRSRQSVRSCQPARSKSGTSHGSAG